jgi:hypothetical protein
MLRLSQQSLTLLETCPRQFQHGVLEGLVSPPATEQQRSLDWGDRFHRLMQQYALQLPLEPLLAEDDRLRQAFHALQTQLHMAQPDWSEAISAGAISAGAIGSEAIGAGAIGSGAISAGAISAGALSLDRPASENSTRQPVQWESEHQRSYTIQTYPFTVIYDLLLISPDQAQILDWKTYPQPPTSRALAQNWQTRLYCYLLVETSDYRPDQVMMTYWFIPTPSNGSTDKPTLSTTSTSPSYLQLPYNSAEHRATGQILTQLLRQLEPWLQDYRHKGKAFPQVAEGSPHCDRCPFAERCQRVSSLESRFDISTMRNLAAINEIALRSQ